MSETRILVVEPHREQMRAGSIDPVYLIGFILTDCRVIEDPATP